VARDFNDVLREEGIEAAIRLDASATKYQPTAEVGDENKVFQFKPKTEAAPKPLPWLDMSGWDDVPVPHRDWVILNRVPAETFGIFSGEGGVGKSRRNVGHSPTASNYAPKTFAGEGEAKKAKLHKVDLEAAMRRLFEAKKIVAESYGKPSNPHSRLKKI
jgi:hypothetical protein